MTGRQQRGTLIFLLLTLAVRLYWAYAAPLANDEAYYWDWSRALQLSFIDHPPAVAWVAALGDAIIGSQTALGPRFLLPFLHLAATLVLLACAKVLKGDRLTRAQVWTLLVFTEVVPAFSLEGVLLLPDSGLLLALALSLYTFLRAASSERGCAWRWVLPAGLAVGAAGLCKYHAAPIACGLGIGLLIYGSRRQRLGEFVRFLIVTALLALLVTSPVLIWNASHDWASFRFQSAHGFAGLSFTPLAAARVYFGQLLILSPLVVIGTIQGIWRQRDLSLTLLPVAAAAPLFALLEILAFGKQMLPHWLAPACWMVLPLLALTSWPRWAFRANVVLAVSIAWVLPWVLTLKPLREALVNSFDGKPGPLSELTLWQPLSESLMQDARVASYLKADGKAVEQGNCPQTITVASLRWFWSAQLAFHLPGQPRVVSLDQNHRSYYNYRDYLPDYANCPVLLIADARHVDADQLRKVLGDWQQWSVLVPSHRDTDVIALYGRFRSLAELEQAAAAMHSYGGGAHPAAY